MKNSFLTWLKPLVAFALYFSFSLSWLSAQQWRYLSEEEGYKKSAEALKNADYIFEGYCTPEGEFFYNEDSTEEFVSIRLVVTHSYKGNLSKGTVELVRPRHRGEHSTGFGLNRKYVIIGQKSTLPQNPNGVRYDNAQTIQLLNEEVPNFHFDYKPDSVTYAVAGLYGRKFRTKTEFYDFLSRSSDSITLPAQEGDKKRSAPLPKDNPPVPKPDTTSNGGNYRLGEVNETIEYFARNQRVYSANGKNYNDAGIIDADELVVIH